MLICVAADAAGIGPRLDKTIITNSQMFGSLITSIMYVFGVNASIKQANELLRTSIASNTAPTLLQDNLNALIILETVSKRCGGGTSL